MTTQVTQDMVKVGPAFIAYRSSSAQSITSATWSKIQFNSEEFDITNAYDSTTNYRFQPTIAGYYQFTVAALLAVACTTCGVAVAKNGTPVKYGTILQNVTVGINTMLQGSAMVYLNGTTDYVEGFAYSNGTSPTITADQTQTYFQGFLVASA